MSTKSAFRLISAVLGAALLLYTAIMIVRAWDDFSQLRLVQPMLLWLNVPLLMLNLLASGKLLDNLLRLQGIRLSLFETLGMSVIARFGNYLSFGQVGFALRMYYLKRVRQVSLADSFSGLALGNLLFYLLAVLVSLASVFWLDLSVAASRQIQLAAAVLLVTIVAGLFLPLLLNSSGRLAGRFELLQIYVRQLRALIADPGLLFWLLFWAAIMLASFTAMLAVELAALGIVTRVGELFYMGAVSSLAGLIQLTPAGVGVQEGLLLLAGSSIDLSAEVLLGASLLRRSIVLLCLALAAPLVSRRLFHTSVRKLNREIDARNATATE